MKAFAKKKCLKDMTREELIELSKEIIVACSDKIVLVYHELPKALQQDSELKKNICSVLSITIIKKVIL